MNEAHEFNVMPPAWPMPLKEREMDQVDLTLRRTMRMLLDGEKPWPLFLHGEPGSGKTCALMCLVDHCGGGVYVTLGDLCRALIDAQHGRTAFYDLGAGITRTEGELWRDWGNGNVCVLDEIGTREKVSEHHYSTLQMALDRRNDPNRPLVVVSNVDLKGSATLYDDRIASRLASGMVIETTGDRRLNRGAKSAEVTG